MTKRGNNVHFTKIHIFLLEYKNCRDIKRLFPRVKDGVVVFLYKF